MILSRPGSIPQSPEEAIARLLELADYLEFKISPSTFDMGDWFSSKDEQSWDPDTDQDEQEAFLRLKNPYEGCGTTACIAGHAVALFDDNAAWINNIAHRGAVLLGSQYWSDADVKGGTSEPGFRNRNGEPVVFMQTDIESPAEAASELRRIASRIKR